MYCKRLFEDANQGVKALSGGGLVDCSNCDMVSPSIDFSRDRSKCFPAALGTDVSRNPHRAGMKLDWVFW